MRKALAPVAALLVSVAILLTGHGLQTTLLPVRAGMENFSTLAIGTLGSAYFLGFAAGCLFGPFLVRRVGHIRTFTAMAAIASAAPLVHTLVLMPAPWSVMRFITGYCFAVLYIVIESWLNERSTNETRGLVLSVYVIINLTVLTLGQMMITLYEPSGFQLFALASIIVSLAAVPIAMTVAPAPKPVESVKVRPLRIYAISPVGFAGSLGVGFANGAWWSLAPLFAERSGFDVNGIALFMSATVLGGAIGQWPLGRLSDRMDRRKVLVGASLVAAATGVAMYLLSSQAGNGLPALGAVWGMTAFPLYAIAVAHTNDHAKPDEFVEVSSGLLLVYAAGAVIGPVLASALMSQFGNTGLYATTAAIHLILAGFAMWRMSRRAPTPVEQHLPFAESLQATQTASTVFDTEIQADHEAELEERPPGPAGDAPAPR